MLAMQRYCLPIIRILIFLCRYGITEVVGVIRAKIKEALWGIWGVPTMDGRRMCLEATEFYQIFIVILD